jgi:integrase
MLIMPKITNERYATFFDSSKEFKEYSAEEFLNNLKDIHYDNPYKQEQARALAIALWYTGLRGVEILTLRTHQIEQGNRRIRLRLKGAKNGIEGTISLPVDPWTKELYNFSKKLPPEALIFPDFISYSKSNVKYKRKSKFSPEEVYSLIQKNKDGLVLPDIQDMQKTYPHFANKLYYFLMKWFGVSNYYFRHSRFTVMKKGGASLESIRLHKLGKTESSARMYIKYDTADADRDTKDYPKLIK